MNDRPVPTAAERLLLGRRRAGIKQIEAARRHSVSRDVYIDWENGHRLQDVPDFKLEPTIQDHELCLLYRRRVGWTQEKVAAALDMCKFTVRKMELGRVNCDDLLSFWEC